MTNWIVSDCQQVIFYVVRFCYLIPDGKKWHHFYYEMKEYVLTQVVAMLHLVNQDIINTVEQ